MPNPKREIMCCLRCGRDTRAKDGLTIYQHAMPHIQRALTTG